MEKPQIRYNSWGILAQSVLFVAIFYGIQIIWERDAGILTKLMVTPTPRAALIAGKAFASGVRSLTQVVVVLVLAAVLGVGITVNPLRLLGVVVVLMLSAGFFSCLSMTIAGLVLSRDRLRPHHRVADMGMRAGTRLRPSVYDGCSRTRSEITDGPSVAEGVA